MRFSLCGKVPGEQQHLVDELTAAGLQFQKQVVASTDVVIVGMDPRGNNITRSRRHGVAVWTAAMAREYLASEHRRIASGEPSHLQLEKQATKKSMRLRRTLALPRKRRKTARKRPPPRDDVPVGESEDNPMRAGVMDLPQAQSGRQAQTLDEKAAADAWCVNVAQAVLKFIWNQFDYKTWSAATRRCELPITIPTTWDGQSPLTWTVAGEDITVDGTGCVPGEVERFTVPLPVVRARGDRADAGLGGGGSPHEGIEDIGTWEEFRQGATLVLQSAVGQSRRQRQTLRRHPDVFSSACTDTWRVLIAAAAAAAAGAVAGAGVGAGAATTLRGAGAAGALRPAAASSHHYHHQDSSHRYHHQD